VEESPPDPEAALPDRETAESQGRTALVTGGGRGIGRAIALALAAESHAVAVADIGEEEAAETASMIASGQGRAHAVRLDVTHPILPSVFTCSRWMSSLHLLAITSEID
jgi:NAD(P)-dependent dehydrogenase (short-subunit alcohol dehydrogenase family)